MVNIALML